MMQLLQTLQSAVIRPVLSLSTGIENGKNRWEPLTQKDSGTFIKSFSYNFIKNFRILLTVQIENFMAPETGYRRDLDWIRVQFL